MNLYANRLSLLLVVSSLTAACTSVPSFDHPGGHVGAVPTVAELVKHIQCQLRDIKSQASDLTKYRYVASAQLTVDVTNLEGSAPNLNYINPYRTPMTNFAMGVGGQYTATQHRNMTQTFSITVGDQELTGAASICSKDSEGNRLQGDLGLRAVVEAGLRNVDANDFVFPQASDNATKLNQTLAPVFGSTIDFTVVYGINNVGPTWTLTHFKGPGGGSAGGGGMGGAGGGSGGGGSGGGSQGLLTLTRTSKDTLVISFAPACPSGRAANGSCPDVAPAARAVGPSPPPAPAPAPAPAAGPAPPKSASALERANLAAVNALRDSTTALTATVEDFRRQTQAQIDATNELRAIVPTRPVGVESAARAAQDNNTRMILQNLISP